MLILRRRAGGGRLRGAAGSEGQQAGGLGAASGRVASDPGGGVLGERPGGGAQSQSAKAARLLRARHLARSVLQQNASFLQHLSAEKLRFLLG